MIDGGFFTILFGLLVGHALADYALQTKWMVQAKSPRRRVSRRQGERPDLIWLHVLSAHALIHGGAVALVTGSPALGLAETVCHWGIDYGKSSRWYGFHVDQFLHLGCKLLWALIWLAL